MKNYIREVNGYLEFRFDDGVNDNLEMKIKVFSDSGLHKIRSLVNTCNWLIEVEEKEKHWRPKYKGN